LDVLKDLFLRFSGAILDVGCGYSLVADFQPNVIGVDISSPRNVSYPIKADAMNMPIENDSIDCVHLGEVIEHFDNHNQKDVLLEIRRVLRDNGLMIVSTPNISDAYGDHKNMLEYKQFKELVTSSNFMILESRGIYCKYFSRTGLYRKLKNSFLKAFLMRLTFPASISFNVILLCQKRE
jgi:SAM-dependent methyltransferase